MNLRTVIQMVVLLTAQAAMAQTSSYQVEFPQAHYEVSVGQEFMSPVRIDPLPASGLFSYGLICTVEGSSGLAGIVAMTPRSSLNFDGVVGAGSRGVTAGTGRFSGKGSVNIQLPGKDNHLDPILGSIAIAGLPLGDYTLRLATYNTLGPTESIFVNGQGEAIDSETTFGTASLSVKAVQVTPAGTITPVGAMTADRQTGLLLQKYDVKNTGAVAAVFRILIKNLPAGSVVWNSQGKFNGVPYIDLPSILAVGATTRITIEYYSKDRKTIPNPTFELVGASGTVTVPEGEVTNIKPRATLSGGNVLLEFNSEIGRSYYIQYTSDLTTWKTALPKVDGTGNRIQWIDNGSPKTESSPSNTSSRFYRILATQTAK